MNKRFIHFKTKTAFNAATLGTDYYDDSIVFIKSSQEIWTHGQFYAIPDAYKNKITSLETAVAALQASSVSTINGSNAIKVTGTGTTRTVSLALNNAGKNITLSQDENGLSAQVTNVDTLIPVDGIVSGDKVLTLTDKKIGSTIKFAVDTTADAQGKRYLRLTGVNDADLGKVDVAEFVKDGMINNVSFNQTSKILTITFNTDAGKEAINVDLSALVDIYDGSNLRLKAITVPSTYTQPAANTTLDVAIANLIKKDNDLNTRIDTLNADLNTVSTNCLTQINKGTDGTYVTTTVSAKSNKQQSVSVAVKTKEVASATTSDNGLAVAADVKSYVDDLFAWEELD